MTENYKNFIFYDAEIDRNYILEVSPEVYARLETDEIYAAEMFHKIKNATAAEEADARSSNIENQGISSTIEPASSDLQFNDVLGNEWSYEKTQLLISCYDSHKDERDNYKTNKYLWENVANDMISHKYNVTPTNCSDKWNNLLRSYKNKKDKDNKTGQAPSRFLFFDAMDPILRNRPSNSSCHVIASLENHESTSTENESQETTTTDENSSKIANENSGSTSKKGKQSCKRGKSSIDNSNDDDFKKMKLAVEKEKNALRNRRLDLEERKIAAIEKYLSMKPDRD